MDTSPHITKVLSPPGAAPASVGGTTVSYSPPQTNSSSTGNIIFTILLCGFGILLIYVIFRIKKLEMTMIRLEQRQQQVVQNGIRDWFQIPENIHYLQHNMGRNHSSSVLSFVGPSAEEFSETAPYLPPGSRDHHQCDTPPPAKPAANPLSGLMSMCGMDLLGSMMAGAGAGGGGNPAPFPPSEVFGVTIGAMPAAAAAAHPPPPEDSKIVEISEGEEVDKVKNEHVENDDDEEVDCSLDDVNNEKEVCRNEKEETGIAEIDVDEEENSEPPASSSSSSAAKKRSYTRRQAKK